MGLALVLARIHLREGVAGLALILVLFGCTSSSEPIATSDASGGARSPVVEPTGSSPSGDAPDQASDEVDPEPDLYLFDPTSGEAVPILLTEEVQREPERSPDGTHLVYQGEVSGDSQIFVLEENGTERQLTDVAGGALEPSWSPDGSQIAFAARSGAGGNLRTDTDIFVMDADGGHFRRLMGTRSHDRSPDWSPDGSRIAFDAGGQISVVSVADGVLRRLTQWKGSRHENPTWSPDGRWITYTRWGSGTINERLSFAHLMLMRADGSEKQRLDPSRRLYFVYELSASWSPDGRSIAFTSGNCLCIHVIDVLTQEAVLLDTSPVTYIDDLSWGTDGIVGCGGCQRGG